MTVHSYRIDFAQVKIGFYETGLFTKLATPPISFKNLLNAYQSVCLQCESKKSP